MPSGRSGIPCYICELDYATVRSEHGIPLCVRCYDRWCLCKDIIDLPPPDEFDDPPITQPIEFKSSGI